jgi:hypothetical protein
MAWGAPGWLPELRAAELKRREDQSVFEASDQRPSRAMPIGVMRYLAGSAARSTCAAVVQLTSCSADWPPNSTIRLIRPSPDPAECAGAG